VDAQGTTAGPDPTRVVDLGDLVRELNLLRSRAARGTRSARISLEELASRVGEPKSTIHAYLTGKRLAPSQMLDRMVIALGTTPAEQREWAEAWYRVCAHREVSHRTPVAEPAHLIVPRQLPQAVEHFTGRLEALAELDRLLGGGSGIAALVGPAGTGTTALAVHWAQARSDRFPDGQLYVDLRGFDPDPPLLPGQVLARFLRALGVPAAEVPRECAERAAHYRSLLAGRRMLVVLDNARDSEQVRELLPGTSSCAVLVTSRQRLTGLVARHGAHQIPVPPLPADEAVQLLQVLAGNRLDPEVAAELAAQCAGLPLALRLTGELLRDRLAPAELVAEFAVGASRLDLLAAGDDPRTAIRNVYGWSYQRLTAPAARAFRLIGRYPALELTAHTLAALLDSGPAEAQRLLGTLVDAHLMEQSRPGCYRMPELLRLYASELEADEGPAAVSRAVDYYLHTAAQAVDLLSVKRPLRRAEPSPAGTAPMPDPDTARRWLAAESGNLLAVARHVCQGDWPWQTVRLARTVAGYLEPAEPPAPRLLEPAVEQPAAELGVNF